MFLVGIFLRTLGASWDALRNAMDETIGSVDCSPMGIRIAGTSFRDSIEMEECMGKLQCVAWAAPPERLKVKVWA